MRRQNKDDKYRGLVESPREIKKKGAKKMDMEKFALRILWAVCMIGLTSALFCIIGLIMQCLTKGV